MTDNLFTETTVVDVDPNKDYVAEMVGEGKKYATPDEALKQLAKKAAFADAHIARLEAEAKARQDAITAAARLEELVAKLSTISPGSNDRPQEDRETGVTGAETRYSPEDEEKRIEAVLEKREAARRRQENVETVVSTLRDHFGPDFQNKLRDKARELGLGEKFLNSLAAEQPKAFFTLIGINNQPTPSVFTSVAPPQPSVNTASFRPDSGNKKTASYYYKIRKEDPKKYESLRLEMHQEAQKLGEAFFDM